jgi:mannose-6-phosphate isomerase-like protein (cupin superfamily)
VAEARCPVRKGFPGFLVLLTVTVHSQTQLKFRDITPSRDFDDVLSQQLYSDSLCTTFIIWIKTEVKAHYHAFHTEQVTFLDGKGEMLLGDKIFRVRKGEMVIIPPGTVHAVRTLSRKPLKVLSVQSPQFSGDDRIFVPPP